MQSRRSWIVWALAACVFVAAAAPLVKEAISRPQHATEAANTTRGAQHPPAPTQSGHTAGTARRKPAARTPRGRIDPRSCFVVAADELPSWLPVVLAQPVTSHARGHLYRNARVQTLDGWRSFATVRCGFKVGPLLRKTRYPLYGLPRGHDRRPTFFPYEIGTRIRVLRHFTRDLVLEHRDGAPPVVAQVRLVEITEVLPADEPAKAGVTVTTEDALHLATGGVA